MLSLNGASRPVRLVAWALGIAGCASTVSVPPGPPTESADLFPLRPGTFWVYQVRSATGEVSLQRVVVRGPAMLRSVGLPGIIVEESGGVSGELVLDVDWHPVAYYRRGDFLYKHSGVTYVDRRLEEIRLGLGEEKVLPSDPVRYPAWESDFEVFHVGPDETYTVRTYSIAEPESEAVRVRAGTFSGCVRVETRSVLLPRSRNSGASQIVYRYLDWYAPGVGIVKTIAEIPGAPRPVLESELVSFRPGKDGD
jgi:hypothetical protein